MASRATTKGVGVIDPGPAGRLKFLHSPGSKELIASIIFFNVMILLDDHLIVDPVEANGTQDGATATAAVSTKV